MFLGGVSFGVMWLTFSSIVRVNLVAISGKILVKYGPIYLDIVWLGMGQGSSTPPDLPIQTYFKIDFRKKLRSWYPLLHHRNLWVRMFFNKTDSSQMFILHLKIENVYQNKDVSRQTRAWAICQRLWLWREGIDIMILLGWGSVLALSKRVNQPQVSILWHAYIPPYPIYRAWGLRLKTKNFVSIQFFYSQCLTPCPIWEGHLWQTTYGYSN